MKQAFKEALVQTHEGGQPYHPAQLATFIIPKWFGDVVIPACMAD